VSDGFSRLDTPKSSLGAIASCQSPNLTNPMMMKGPVREIIPITGQKITLRIPARRRVACVRLLVPARDVPFHAEGDTILFETPSIGLLEVVAVDFS